MKKDIRKMEKGLNVVKSAKKEVLIDGNYFDVTGFAHPGGKVINYYTENGEDATLPFAQFHHRSMKKVLIYRSMLKARVAQENNIETEDSKKMEKQRELTERFKKLHSEFVAEGLFNPSLSHVIGRSLEFFVYLLLSCVILKTSSTSSGIIFTIGLRALGVFMLANAYGRIVWLAHEGGHYSLTGRPIVDAYLQKFFYGFGNGLSASWWNHNHSKHHAMPQRIQKDVDLDTLPLIAFTSKVLVNLKSYKFFIKYQAIFFLPLYTFLVTVRWTLDLHPRFCYYKGQYFELLCIFFHFIFAYTQIGLFNFLLAKWLWSIYMFGNFSLSHTHLSPSEQPKHWVEYGFENTINIEPSIFMDWWMGYLNFQIEHHLFPTMPQFRGPIIRERVMQFAKDNGLPYRAIGYFEAVAMTLKNLQNVSQKLYNNKLE